MNYTIQCVVSQAFMIYLPISLIRRCEFGYEEEKLDLHNLVYNNAIIYDFIELSFFMILINYGSAQLYINELLDFD